MPGGARARLGEAFRRALRPPLRDGRFWLVQGLVILIAIFHEGADATSFLTPYGIPDFATVALFLVPIVYAALSFGLTGSLATAAWVTVISLPDFFVIDVSEHHASDAIQILIVDAVALFVGYWVDQERLARLAAEAAVEAHRAAEERIRLYAGRILHAQEDERRRLSQELHDQPLQDLIHLVRRLDVGSTEGAREVATQVVSELRLISRGLRPPSLDDLGLVAALRKLVADFSARTTTAASFRAEGHVLRLPADVELGLFRIAQEALNNVSRHAAAARVTVRARYLDGEVRLTITDDGAGFTPGQAAESSLGIAGMSERAALLDGRLEVISAAGRGTTIRASIPVVAAEPVPAC
jgi:signal transduction histidine kinase